MGIAGISATQLLVILAIVVLLFGTKKLRNSGGDVGAAIRNFKNAIRNDEGTAKTSESLNSESVSA